MVLSGDPKLFNPMTAISREFQGFLAGRPAPFPADGGRP